MALPLPRIALGLMLGIAISGSSAVPQLPVQAQVSNCDWASYPDFCIPFYPPDLDCQDIGAGWFTVFGPDPHFLDEDFDGIGCEL